MTKVTILGQPQGDEPKKKIEFTHCLLDSVSETTKKPELFKNVELISKNYLREGVDLMFAYNDDRNDQNACLYLGHFNDGIV